MANSLAPVVLIVEDEEETRFILSELLGEVGFTTDEAVDGIQALSAIALRIPSIIVTDLRMPNMNGLELAKKLKSNPLLKRIPIFLLSGTPPWDSSELSMFAQVFTKPIPLEILVKRIRSYLR